MNVLEQIFLTVLNVKEVTEKVLFMIVSVFLDIGMLELTKTVLNVAINVNLVT